MLDLPRGSPREALFSPDGHLILTLGWELEVRVHRASTGEVVWAARLEHPAENWSFSPNGREVGALSGERLLLWDLTTGQRRESELAPLPVLPFTLGPGPDQLTHAAAEGYLTTLRISDWHRCWTRLVGGESLQRLAFEPQGRALLGVGATGCRVWEIPSGRCLASSQGRAPAALSTTRLMATRSPGLVEEVTLATGARRRMAHLPAVQALSPEGSCLVMLADGLAYHDKCGASGWEIRGHSRVQALAIHQGELVSAHRDPYLRSWPAGRHEQLWGGVITCLAAGPAGLAVGLETGEVRLGERRICVEGEVRGLFEAACGRLAILSGADALSVWEGDRCLLRRPGCPLMAGQGERVVIWGHAGVDELNLTTLEARSLAREPAGTHLAAGSAEGQWLGARGLRVRLGQQELALPAPVCALAAGPDQSWAAATEDSQVLIFQGSQEVARHCVESPVTTLLWSPGGLWAGTREGWLHAYAPDPLGWLINFWDREWVAGTAEGWESSPRAGRHLGLWEKGSFVPHEEAPPELPGTARRLRKCLMGV